MQLEGVLGPYGQDPASLQLWPQPSFVLAKFSGHHGDRMAISTSGFPGGGLARESTVYCPLKGWVYQGPQAHPEHVAVAGAWRPLVDQACVSGPLLGARETGSGGGSNKWGGVP